jgi:hypothetical protein
MNQLRARRRTLALQESSDARQWFDLGIVPDSEIAEREAPRFRDGEGLGKDQAGSALCKATKMYQMKVGRQAIGFSCILL